MVFYLISTASHGFPPPRRPPGPSARYSEVAPALREYRAAVLDVAKNSKVPGEPTRRVALHGATECFISWWWLEWLCLVTTRDKEVGDPKPCEPLGSIELHKLVINWSTISLVDYKVDLSWTMCSGGEHVCWVNRLFDGSNQQLVACLIVTVV